MASRATALVIAAAMAAVVVGALLPATASAAVYRVGDGSGWGLGVDYNAWARGKDFKVGDIIEFVYPNDSHDVVMVDARSYNACAVLSDAPAFISGFDRVEFEDAGQRFFICTFQGHCKSGMKLAVNVQ